MLPPPTTTAGWMPRSTTSASCRATSAVAPSEIPDPESCANASPESFSKTRWYVGRASPPSLMRLVVSSTGRRHPVGGQLTRLLQVLAQPVAGEPPHRHLLAGLGADLVQQALDRLRVVLDERLIKQDVVPEERLEFPFDDPGYHVLGLPGVDRLLLEDLPFVLEGRSRDVVTAQPAWRRGTCDMERQVFHERTEVIRVRHEVRLAVHLDQHPDRVVEMDVGVDQALVGTAAGALGLAGETLLAEDLRGALGIAVGLDQGALAIHHARAGRFTKRLHHGSRDVRHVSLPPPRRPPAPARRRRSSSPAPRWARPRSRARARRARRRSSPRSRRLPLPRASHPPRPARLGGGDRRGRAGAGWWIARCSHPSPCRTPLPEHPPAHGSPSSRRGSRRRYRGSRSRPRRGRSSCPRWRSRGC